MHLFDAGRRFLGGNAIVGGHLPLATGIALADKMLHGSGRATACIFGEGAVAEGEFHEAMNLATIWNLPVLFCCENNLYAMGTSLQSSESETNLSLKASSYNMPSWSVDGMDVEATAGAATRALETVRGGGGPVFLEFRTYRFRAHSMFDPDLYRDPDEVAKWTKRDPISTFSSQLASAGTLSQEQIDGLWTEASQETQHAVDFAEAAEWEPVETLEDHVGGKNPTLGVLV